MLSLLIIAAPGCGSDEDGETDDSPSSSGTGASGGTGGGGTAISCEGAPAELSLAGTWAAKGRLSVTFQGSPDGAITLCPADQTGEANLLLLMTIEQDGSALTAVKAALCDLELPIVTAKVGNCVEGDTNLISTELIAPPALLDTLPTVPAMPATGTVDGTAINVQGLKVTVGSTTSGDQMASWKADDTACTADTLGRTNECEATCVTDCASLRDDDNDGYPGVTLHVCGYAPGEEQGACSPEEPSQTGVSVQGRGFLNIEVSPTLDGTAESSCEVRGNVDTPILYNLVGADVFLGPGPISVSSAIKSLPTFEVDGAQSTFRMVRIDGEYGAPDWAVDPAAVVAACKTIVSKQNEL
jgi:hypothetical protein